MKLISDLTFWECCRQLPVLEVPVGILLFLEVIQDCDFALRLLCTWYLQKVLLETFDGGFKGGVQGRRFLLGDLLLLLLPLLLRIFPHISIIVIVRLLLFPRYYLAIYTDSGTNGLCDGNYNERRLNNKNHNNINNHNNNNNNNNNNNDINLK